MNQNIENKIYEDLKNLGIVEGDIVLVHSSLKALGNFSDKDRVVTNALLRSIGDMGTLLMPTLSYESVTTNAPEFSYEDTPSCVGWLSEYFRRQPNVKRSIHPTHSVCAIGKNADALIKDHLLDNTPCGENSPFRKLRDFNGKILFLGCSLNSNTSMHGVEELVIPEYLFGAELLYTLKLKGDKTIEKKYVSHNFDGFKQCYDRVLNILAKDDYIYGKVLEADAYVIKSNPLWDKAHKKLSNKPLFFVEKTN